MKAETADYLAKARAALADAIQIATLPPPHIAAREAYLAVFRAAEAITAARRFIDTVAQVLPPDS